MTTGIGIFRPDSPDIIGVGVDLKLSETHKAEAQITNQPIEDGSIVSDHIILQPDTVEIIAEMSNFDAAGSQSVGERASTVWAEFKTAIQARTLFELVTFHEIYENMALESLTGDHAAPYRGKLQLNLKFRRVDSTQLGVVAVPESQLAPDVAKQASTEVDGGRQTPKDVSGLTAILNAGTADGSTR